MCVRVRVCVYACVFCVCMCVGAQVATLWGEGWLVYVRVFEHVCVCVCVCVCVGARLPGRPPSGEGLACVHTGMWVCVHC